MNTHEKRTDMIITTLLGLAGFVFIAGCGPTFDPASLIESTRVVGARSEVEGAPERATPRPGETADVTWLVTAPQAPPPLHWAFAVCTVENASLGCDGAPLALFEGTDAIPRIAVPVPPADALGTAAALVVYGRLCPGDDSLPMFDPQQGIPSCTDGGGTTVSTSIPLQLADADANHNPTADRAFTFDGQPWPALGPDDDPCLMGPRVPADSPGHVIGNATEGSDREPYPTIAGDPPLASAARESLQISQFTTAGAMKSQFSFVEATDENATTTVEVKWDAPKAAEVPAVGRPVTFTFVVRDNRGGTDWTTRALCVTR
jgi:hypothetical protein